MDILHHTAIGAIGSTALASAGHPVSGMAFLLGSVVPDLDVAFMAFGRRAYLRNHQGASHSLLVSPFLAGLVSVPFMFFLWPEWRFFVSAMLGIWIHVLLDACNTFGVSWLWPLSRRRDCLDAVFFVDLTAWLITGAALLAILVIPAHWVAPIYVVVFCIYTVARAGIQRYGRRRFGCTLAIPSALCPWELLTLEELDGIIRTCTRNVATGARRHERDYQAASERYEELAGTSSVFRDMRSIARYLAITNVEQRDGEISIVAHDLGIRNFGGKFGRTTLRFDETGKLIHEMANI